LSTPTKSPFADKSLSPSEQYEMGESEKNMFNHFDKITSTTADEGAAGNKSQSLPNITDETYFLSCGDGPDDSVRHSQVVMGEECLKRY